MPVRGVFPRKLLRLKDSSSMYRGLWMNLSMGYDSIVFRILLFTIFTAVSSRPDNIRIVGLFDNSDTESERHMRHAIERLNSNRTILPRRRLSAHIVRMMPDENFHVAKKVCGQIDVGSLAIVGPYVPSKLPVVQSTSTHLNVPHLSTAPAATQRRRVRGSYSLYLYPPDSALSRAYRDVIASRGWKSFTIIYDNPR